MHDKQLHLVTKPVLCGAAGYFHSLVVWPNSLVKRYEKTRKKSQPYHTLSAIRHQKVDQVPCLETQGQIVGRMANWGVRRNDGRGGGGGEKGGWIPEGVQGPKGRTNNRSSRVERPPFSP